MSGAAPAPSIRILLVGGHPLFQKALQARLRNTRLRIVGVESGSEDVAAHAQTLAADVVLLDASQSGESVADAGRRIAARESAPKVVVLTDEHAEVDTAGAQRAGAVAFVQKPAALDDLVDTLELVLTLLVDTTRAQAGS